VKVNSHPAPQEVAAAGSERGLRRAMLAARTAAENRGRDIVILDVRRLTAMFD